MEHEISIRTQAAERYLLGELQPDEREEFEQHFFECPECAEDVRLGFQFSETAKTVFRREADRLYESVHLPKRRDWFAFMRPAMLAPVAAGLAVVAFSAYQNVVQIPALRARVGQLQRPQVLSSIVLAPSSRSSVPSVTISPAAQFFQATLAFGAVPPAQQYQCELRSDQKKSITTIPVPKIAPDTDLTVLIPTASISPGYYSPGYYDAVLLGLTGGTATELDHYRFAVRREQISAQSSDSK